MSIQTLPFKDYHQKFHTTDHNKLTYGEVHTDFILINQMLDLLPEELFYNHHKKWLDPCCGKGYFFIALYQRLFKHLSHILPDPQERHTHIIENMLYMVELNGEHIPELFSIFGENANILNGDFLSLTNQKYDIIIGNPPFNINGRIKVPTRKNSSKKADGKRIWGAFVKKAIQCLNYFGTLVFITPAIWMKSDHPMNSFMTHFRIQKLHTMTNTETNRIFHGQAQTPTCYFLLRAYVINETSIDLYDTTTETYIHYRQPFDTKKSLPMSAAALFKKLQPFIKKSQSIVVKKTNMPRKKTQFSLLPHKKFPYKNIKTCILNQCSPKLVVNYSNIPCAYADIPKLVLAHKMYGFPFHDKKGEYGVSNRDNYIIYGKTEKELERLKDFLSTKFALYLFEGTRYRMKYLEKYVFDLIPDISQLYDFPELINDETIADYFQLTTKERYIITHFHKKEYTFF